MSKLLKSRLIDNNGIPAEPSPLNANKADPYSLRRVYRETERDIGL